MFKTQTAFFTLLLAVLGVGPALAQTSMGGVSGTVTDSSGAVVPGANVTLVWNVDLGLQRNIRVFSERNLAIRLEVFNVFNHINLGNPAVVIDNPAQVARITSMNGSPRQLQLGLRMTF